MQNLKEKSTQCSCMYQFVEALPLRYMAQGFVVAGIEEILKFVKPLYQILTYCMIFLCG